MSTETILARRPSLLRDPVTGRIMKGTPQIWTQEELSRMGKKGSSKRMASESDFNEKSRRMMVKLRAENASKLDMWEQKRKAAVRDSASVKIQCRRIQKIGQPLALEVIKNDPRFQEGLQNISRKDYSLISPDLEHYEGENLMHFVRTHKDLFNPEDVKEPLSRSRAYAGLRQMVRPSPNFTARSWKGWVKAD